ncbi:MAG: nucleotidyl transferase AbiEii/AbiGii toxin family protein [Elusimicrobia bacterium]|nr:nucleotidyl transferase AbiEii/AbiGii toxin family protein [Elusimicrobiota bacterium]
MIPEAAITHWRNVAPWPQDAQVEQDLILCRALTEIFQEPALSKALLLRGGTALLKLLVKSPHRYSEDIDLVQVAAGPIGPVMSAIRARLDPILGQPRRENNPDNVTLRYRMESEIAPVVPLRLKIEINSREHFSVFDPEYQRRKGRDLFDLWLGLDAMGADPRRVTAAFRRYLDAKGHKITRKLFERNLEEKAASRQFSEDLRPLLAAGVRYDAAEAARVVTEKLLSIL